MNKIREVKSVVAAELRWKTGCPCAGGCCSGSAVEFRMRIPLHREVVKVVTLTSCWSLKPKIGTGGTGRTNCSISLFFFIL